MTGFEPQLEIDLTEPPEEIDLTEPPEKLMVADERRDDELVAQVIGPDYYWG